MPVDNLNLAQPSLFDQETEHNTHQQLAMPDANVVYYPKWLSPALADTYLMELQRSLAWRQDTIKLYGKEHLIPRLQAWYGDKGAYYAYSGVPLEPIEWTPTLAEIKGRCETIAQSRFNSVLANWYRDGKDSMGMHSDDEPQLGYQPVIASVSLGAERVFVFKHKHTKQRVPIALAHGSLLLMRGATQHYWQHGINKTTKLIGDRLNLTFRYVQQDDSINPNT